MSDSQVKPDGWAYFKRALRLLCPECGKCRLFVPLRKVRRMRQWLHPLDGCPRCGYEYEREPGYFLMSIWMINLGVIGGFGIGALFLLDNLFHLPLWQTLLIGCPGIPVLNLLFVRHAKSLFLALDHYFDPHVTQEQPSLVKAEHRGRDWWDE